MNNAAIEALRNFAMSNNEIAFAHLCTAALNGEEWAAERINSALRALCGLAFSQPESGVALAHIRRTDTTRPDGAIARSVEI